MKEAKYENTNEFKDLIPQFNTRRMDLDLKRITNALNAIGNPCKSIPAIQVAGTNGKGSITSFISNSLKIANIHAGVTTSPHLISWCERIKVNETLISPKELRNLLTYLQPFAKSEKLTTFELLIAAAFSYFAKKKVEILVLEVGLGGRLDATTAHPYRPVIAIGPIALDHVEHLGGTLEKIAIEKAAVITTGAKVISAKQHPLVTKILEERAVSQGTKIKWVTPLTKDWQLGLSGEVQRQNAAIAKAALEAITPLGWNITETQMRLGFKHAHWPGRLQSVTWRKLPLLIDGAHNPLAANLLSKELHQCKKISEKLEFILGIQSQKDGPEMLRQFLGEGDKAWIVPIPKHQSWNQSQLSKACPELSKQLFQANSVEQVLSELNTKQKWPTPPPVVAGSLYLIGDLLSRQIIKAE